MRRSLIWRTSKPARDDWNGGYTPPVRAADEFLMEPVEAYLDEIDRLARLGLEDAASAICEGVLLGLYRLRDVEHHDVMGWAPDFAPEAADFVVSRWSKAKGPSKGRRWLAEEFVELVVPEWSGFLAELERRRSRRR